MIISKRMLERASSLLLVLLLLSSPACVLAQQVADYGVYHQQVGQAEELIVQHQYAQALSMLEHTITTYPYSFVRDYKLAVQLALYLKDTDKALRLLRGSIASGWTLKEMDKSAMLAPLRASKSDWQLFRTQYPTLRKAYEQHLNQPLRATVRAMAKQDQKLAFANLAKLRKQAKDRFLREKFAPHSARQLATLDSILHQWGYPGEKLIGNGNLMARILSHHNSITVAHTQQDTLYPHLQPYLLRAIQRGELAPAEYATIDEWYVVIKSAQQEEGYGYLNSLTEQELPVADARRQRIGLRSVELRNQLVAVQEQTGMNLFLDGTFWVKGRIQVVAKRGG